MRIPEEDLICYLLGDANAELRTRVEQALLTDEELRQRVVELRNMLGHLDSTAEQFEPPADLVERTLARIDEESAIVPAKNLRPAEIPARQRLASWDSAAISLSLAVLCCLILPAVVRARYVARKLQCSANLQEAGQMLTSFAGQQPDDRFPAIPLSGPQAFAGFYVVRLSDSGLPIEARQLQCPSRIGIDPEVMSPPAEATAAELNLMSANQLAEFQRSAGGDYAYALGITVDGNVVAPQQQGNSHFPILADAPLMTDEREHFLAHDGRGVNILYADGRVVFIDCKSITRTVHNPLDDPFTNLLGTHEVGLSPQDASLAPSHFPPVKN